MRSRSSSMRGCTRVWATLGVRGAKLRAWYAKAPHWRPAGSAADKWEPVPSYQTGEASFVILADELAEIELPGLAVLSREDLRKTCDAERTKDKIVAALSK